MVQYNKGKITEPFILMTQPLLAVNLTTALTWFTPFAPFLANAASAVIGSYLTVLIPKLANNKYYQVAIKVLPALNNVLASEDTTGYGASGVQKIVTETIKAFTDGQLTPDEVLKVANLTLQLFNPKIAASAPVTKEGAAILAEIKATPDINNLNLGGIKVSVTP